MSDNSNWYVVHTYSGYEKKVAATVLKTVENLKLHDYILEVNVPTEEVTEISETRKTKIVERKIFPSYVLIKMVMTDDSWHAVRNIRGITGFVGPGGKPVPLTEDEISSWGLEKHEIVVPYNEGDSVRIAEGPLASYIGVVEEISRSKNMVRVVVSMFNRETPVELELDQVEPL